MFCGFTENIYICVFYSVVSSLSIARQSCRVAHGLFIEIRGAEKCVEYKTFISTVDKIAVVI